MSEQINGSINECLLSRQDMQFVDMKFFRGHRDGHIAAFEIYEQMRDAMAQKVIRADRVSERAPVSAHAPIEVADFLATV